LKEDDLNLVVFMREYPLGMAGTKRVQHLLSYLKNMGVKIHVISFRSKNVQPAIEGVHYGIPYLNIGHGLDFKLVTFHRIIFYYLKGFSLILKYRIKNQKNIIYCYGGIDVEKFLFISYARLLRYKLVCDIAEDYSYFEDQVKLISRFKFWTTKHLDSLTYRWSAALVIISQHLLNKYSNMGSKRLALIPITANQNFDPKKNTFNSPTQVVYSGSFDKKDGVNDIIEGFRIFNSEFNEAKLILTGKSDQQLQYKKKYENHPNIIFKGYVPDDEFYELLKNADILCMCRNVSEFANAGFPFKLGEYLATGNPVIATKVSDVEQYLTSDDAYLIQPNSPLQISKSLLKIVSNPEEARKIGLNGLRKCKQFFSPETNGEILYELFKTI